MNLTIKNKLLGGFLVILGLLVFMSVFMGRKFSDSNERLVNIVESSSKKINLSNELMIAVLEAARHEKNIIMEKDPVRKDYYKDRLYDALAAVNAKTLEIEDLVDPKGRIILDQFKLTWAGFVPDLDKIVSLAISNENEKAYNLSVDRGLKIRDLAITQLQRLIERNEKSMQQDKELNEEAYAQSLNLIISLVVLAIVLAIAVSFWIIQTITRRIAGITREAEKIASREHTGDQPEDPLKDELSPVFHSLLSINESFREVTGNANNVASGEYTTSIVPRSEKDTLGNALKKMTDSLRESTEANEKYNWLTTGQNQLNEKLSGDQGVDELAENTINFLCGYLNAQIGAVYVLNDKEETLELNGQFAFTSPEKVKDTFKLNEGLIGQAAKEQKQITLSGLTDDQLHITSSVLHTPPDSLLITPFMFEGKTLGVIEIGRLTAFSDTEKELISNAIEGIGISINSAISRKKIRELLEETQVQSEELQTQQEELKQMNEELEEQAQNLRQQQEELQMTNEELEEQTQSLELKNKEVEAAKADIEQKTKQLEISTRYKSEFLANMSHELRTPLNSLLILSKDLAENKKMNLNHDQVESAEIIYKSGQDLLILINEVLDLSKIEAGKMSLNVERVSLKNFTDELLRDFRHQAEQKGLKLISKLDAGLPETVQTDSQRLKQILKNLLSNAIKFTEKGSVEIEVGSHSGDSMVISVRDSGIGIPEDKQIAVFEAFQQADGGTSRKYGGTGLGLSISRELANLLGGRITLESKPNAGSVFSLILPLKIAVSSENSREYLAPVPQKPLVQSASENTAKFLNYPSVKDDRENLQPGDRVLLIIEDDLKFASILLKQANKKGFRCLSAASGEDGVQLALKYKPHAIMLDLDLPGMNGHQVLAELKANPAVRHIPVHIISVNEPTLDALKAGAIEYLMKPIDKKDLDNAFVRIETFINRKMKHLLIIEDDENARKAMRKLIGNGDVKCFEAGTGEEGLKAYRETHIDCIVLDIGLPDMSGFDFIYKLEAQKGAAGMPPIIIYTGKELSREENNELQEYAESIIIKGVKSEDRLLDETALFLHRTISNLPEPKQIIIQNLYDKEAVFHKKKILLVDDDMRNVFALSKVLKEQGMEIIKAENGINALEMLEANPETDLVLMDIMMPEMDGYEAMRKIREQQKHKNLPIIALTAKAMKDDKQKCIDAGASDYITKPIEVDRLLSLMRVWLSE
ncbi:MAG: response regulator [Bacteroidota bacterium]